MEGNTMENYAQNVRALAKKALGHINQPDNAADLQAVLELDAIPSADTEFCQRMRESLGVAPWESRVPMPHGGPYTNATREAVATYCVMLAAAQEVGNIDEESRRGRLLAAKEAIEDVRRNQIAA